MRGDLFAAGPEPHRQPGQVGRAQCGGLGQPRPQQWYAKDVGLESGQEVVADRTAIGAQLGQRDTGIGLHRIKHVAGLVSHRFQRRAHEVRLARATGQAEHRAAYVTAPIGRTEADKCRYQVSTATVGDLRGQRLAVAGAFDHAQPIAQPLHHRAGDEDRTFQRIFHAPVQAPGDGGQQSVA